MPTRRPGGILKAYTVTAATADGRRIATTVHARSKDDARRKLLEFMYSNYTLRDIRTYKPYKLRLTS